MADAWNAATPTNANTVKTIVPAELQALKQVNIDRLRLYADGLTGYAVPAPTGPVLGIYTINNPLKFTTAQLLTTGAYDATTGEYTVPQNGWYRVTAQLPEQLQSVYGGTGTNIQQALYAIERFNAGVWGQKAATFATREQVGATTFPNAGTIYPTVSVEGIVNCVVGDKLRVNLQLLMNTNVYSGTTPTPGGNNVTANMSIEFMKAT